MHEIEPGNFGMPLPSMCLVPSSCPGFRSCIKLYFKSYVVASPASLLGERGQLLHLIKLSPSPSSPGTEGWPPQLPCQLLNGLIVLHPIRSATSRAVGLIKTYHSQAIHCCQVRLLVLESLPSTFEKKNSCQHKMNFVCSPTHVGLPNTFSLREQMREGKHRVPRICCPLLSGQGPLPQTPGQENPMAAALKGHGSRWFSTTVSLCRSEEGWFEFFLNLVNVKFSWQMIVCVWEYSNSLPKIWQPTIIYGLQYWKVGYFIGSHELTCNGLRF